VFRLSEAFFGWPGNILRDIAVMVEKKRHRAAKKTEAGGLLHINAGTAPPEPRRTGRRVAGGREPKDKPLLTWFRHLAGVDSGHIGAVW
jgi:hypothetical protein